ncbi:hypothetical protein, partial [Aeromonas allosaccharophila]
MWTEELNQSGHHKKGRGITFCVFYIQHIELMSKYRTENGGSFGTLWEICKRPAKAVLTGATGYSAGRATRQGSSSPTR